MVTGPMPRNPNATRPKANTAVEPGRKMPPGTAVLTPYAMAINAIIERPSQKALKLPATNPERMLSDAPPSRDDVTTSFTWLDVTEVNTFTSSGIIAPANVPQVITLDSFHHMEVSLPKSGIMTLDRA